MTHKISCKTSYDKRACCMKRVVVKHTDYVSSDFDDHITSDYELICDRCWCFPDKNYGLVYSTEIGNCIQFNKMHYPTTNLYHLKTSSFECSDCKWMFKIKNPITNDQIYVVLPKCEELEIQQVQTDALDLIKNNDYVLKVDYALAREILPLSLNDEKTIFMMNVYVNDKIFIFLKATISIFNSRITFCQNNDEYQLFNTGHRCFECHHLNFTHSNQCLYKQIINIEDGEQNEIQLSVMTKEEFQELNYFYKQRMINIINETDNMSVPQLDEIYVDNSGVPDSKKPCLRYRCHCNPDTIPRRITTSLEITPFNTFGSV